MASTDPLSTAGVSTMNNTNKRFQHYNARRSHLTDRCRPTELAFIMSRNETRAREDRAQKKAPQ